MTTPPRAPLFVDDGGRSWAVVSVFVVIASAVCFVALGDPIVRRVADWSAGSPALGSVLGWVPIGGFATYLSLLVLRRGHRLARGLSVTRWADRAGIAVALVWLGLAFSFSPPRASLSDRWDALVAVGGPDFSQAVRWCFVWVLVTPVFGLLLGIVLFRKLTAAPPPPGVHHWVALSLAVPYVGLLAVLVAT